MSTFWRQPGVGRADGRRRQRPEEDLRQHVMRLLRWKHWHVYSLSQPRASKQTAGLPDVIAFKGACAPLFIECKAPRGTQSEAQQLLEQLCAATEGKVRYLVVRSAADLAAQLDTTNGAPAEAETP